MTSFVDYIDLRLGVAEMVKRRDISDVLNRHTLAAEDYFNKCLRSREMIVTVPLVFTAGSAPLPADFIEVVTLWDAHRLPIRFTERQIAEPTRSGATIFGSSCYVYGQATPLDCDYYAKLPTLTTSPTTSNWLLQKSPDTYLYGVSLYAARWLRDPALVAEMEAELKRSLNDLDKAEARARWGEAKVQLREFVP